MALFGKPLTPHQSMIWGMREAKKTNPEIAVELGISETVVGKTMTVIRKKLGLTPEGRGASTSLMATPTVKEEAKPIDDGTFGAGMDEINSTMKRIGLPERMREATLKRMRVKHQGEETAAHAATDPELIRAHREKLHLIHTYMDDKVAAEASLRDLAVASSQLVEKLQLLEGRPTAIISDLERKNLLELMPLLSAEAQRRGVTLDGQVTEKVVSPA